MYKKCISIMVFLCLMVMGNSAFGTFYDIGNDGPETRYVDAWLNDAVEVPAVKPFTDHWDRAENWGIGPSTRNGIKYWPPDQPTYHRPPDKDAWAAIEAKYPEPCIFDGSVACARFSVAPWAGPGAGLGYTATVLRDVVEVNCGVQIGLGDKEIWNSEDNGYAVLTVYGGMMHTPGITTTSTPVVTVPPSGLLIGGGPLTPYHGVGLNYGTVNIYGGSIIVPGIQINYGDVNILYKDYGGGDVTHGLLYNTTADTDNNFVISTSHSMNKINIEGNGEVSGELRLKGDRQDQLEDLYKAGRLCACWGHGILYVDFNGTDTSVTAKCTPGSAWNPTPADKKERIPLDQVLSWTPGDWVQDACDPNGTGTHAVYFGTSEVNVTNANEVNQMGVYKGRQDANNYDYPGDLPAGTTCYWRIDEYNEAGGADGNTMWKGEVWEFQTVGGEAIDPVPEDGAVGLPVPLQLSWTPGVFVADTNGHDVYFGTSEANVSTDTNSNLKGTYQGRQTSNVFLLSELDYNLVADTNYYWRVDEVNGSNTWPGETWMFRNTNYFIVDDFESYDSNEALLTRWEIGNDYQSCTNNYGAGEIGWAFVSDNGTMRYDYDNQSGSDNCGACYFSEVRFDANSEDWTGGGALPDNDKTKILAISYIGDSRNSADNTHDPNYDTMYVAIEDTAGNFGSIITNSDEAQRTGEWEQWKVSLYDLNSPNNVNLKAVKYLYLGFGHRCNTGLQGGTGTVNFDDIRLYQRHCVPEYSGLTADLSGDCQVNLDDVNVLADQWLDGQTVVTPVEPNNSDSNLMLWYKFDETTGKVVTDSSGHGYNGDVNVKSGVADDSWWDSTGGYDGNSCLNLILDHNTIVEADKAAMGFVADKNAITFSVWVNADVYSPPSWWPRLVSIWQDTNSYTSYESEVLEIHCPTARPPENSDGPSVTFITTPEASGKVVSTVKSMQMSDFGGGWHHYAFVKDVDANFMSIYHNGGDVNTTTTNPMFGLPLEAFRISEWERDAEPLPVGKTWTGRIDDFRVYNYALSPGEIAWLAGFRSNPSYVPVPFNATANLRSSTPEAVNFGDLAILAQQWLSGPNLWP